MIPIFWPSGPKLKWQILFSLYKVFRGRWWGQGPLVDKFDKKFGEHFGYDYCVSTNSGSSALELAYRLAGITDGDKVLTPVFTCTATNIPLKRMGAKIEFVDVNPRTWCMDLEDFRNKVKGAKAIVTVNVGGIMCSKEIYQIAKKAGIPVIVDAAQSLGITEPRGDFICYSFQGIKHFTTGDGGMLVTRDEYSYNRAKRLRWFGIDREAKKRNGWNPYKDRKMIVDIEEPGYKFHMNDIQAAMGLVGLKNTDKLLKHRIRIANIYNKGIPNHHKVFGGSCWLFGVEVENRDKVSAKLLERGIETNVVQLRNDIFSVFGGRRRKMPHMNRLEQKYLYLPIHSKMSLRDAKYIVKEFNKLT